MTKPTRRQLLELCAEKGMLLGTLASLPFALVGGPLDDPQKTTPENEMGPFYKKGAPASSVLRPAGAPGFGLEVKGRVHNTHGDLVEGVEIEIWQADHDGHYDLKGHNYRARLVLPRTAEYDFQSVMPGHYPDRVAQHIHYLVRAPGHKPLVTQLYFGTDPVFLGDPVKNFAKDPLVRNADLIRPVAILDENKVARAQVQFDIVLERA